MSNQNSANTVNWDEDFNKEERKTEGESKKVDFMAFPEPGIYTIRLVGPAVKFHRHWDPFTLVNKKARIFASEAEKDQNLAWKAGFWPRLTYAIHVFDRKDGNKLKVLEKGKSIFDVFANYKKVNDIKPSDPVEAPEFVIEVIWPGNDKRQADYKITPKAKTAPLTNEEKEAYKANHTNLADYYKSTPVDKINEEFNALPEELKIFKKKENTKFDKGGKGGNGGNDKGKSNSSSSSKPVETIKEKVDTNNGSDLFEDKDSSDSAPF